MRGEGVGRIRRVLVANRGEIAVRIIKACRALGLEVVAAVSEADRDSLPARMADRAVCLGPAQPAASYLNVGAIVTAAVGTGADAVHPGYGFLAEQPELAEACARHGLKFIGPRAETLRLTGNKLLARQTAKGCGVPVIAGSENVRCLAEALSAASEVGFPLLIKAAAGGGGRGMRIVRTSEELEEAFETARAEARTAFGDETLYLEQYIPNARHIEIQILGDGKGNAIHVGERDCTLQRRYQKIVEEAPAPTLSEKLREEMRRAAVNLARKVGYENAGTVEFLLDQDSGRFYFLEINARIQVEHPVTEMISGMDLVQEQIRIASGEPLPSQEDVRLAGHAIECRVTAESMARGFQPSPGRITRWHVPEGAGIRVDSHCYAGYFVPPYYDSLLAKLITWGSDRKAAIERMRQALADFAVAGVETNIPFLKRIFEHPDYLAGKVHTKWVEGLLAG